MVGEWSEVLDQAGVRKHVSGQITYTPLVSVSSSVNWEIFHQRLHRCQPNGKSLKSPNEAKQGPVWATLVEVSCPEWKNWTFSHTLPSLSTSWKTIFRFKEYVQKRAARMDGGGEPSHERTDVGAEDFKPEMLLLRNKDNDSCLWNSEELSCGKELR